MHNFTYYKRQETITQWLSKWGLQNPSEQKFFFFLEASLALTCPRSGTCSQNCGSNPHNIVSAGLSHHLSLFPTPSRTTCFQCPTSAHRIFQFLAGIGGCAVQSHPADLGSQSTSYVFVRAAWPTCSHVQVRWLQRKLSDVRLCQYQRQPTMHFVW